MNFFAGNKNNRAALTSSRGKQGHKGTKTMQSMMEHTTNFSDYIDFKSGCAGNKAADEDDDGEGEEEDEGEEEEEEEEGGSGSGSDDDDDDDDDDDEDEDEDEDAEDERANLSSGIGKLKRRRGPTRPVSSKPNKTDKVTSFA